MKPIHRLLLKKAWYLIRNDCDHNVANQPMGTKCACTAILLMSKGESIEL